MRLSSSLVAFDRKDVIAAPRGETAAWAGSLADAQVTFILGGSRSGTSWLGKIFDSHPDVLYRHEPDRNLDCDTISRHAARGTLTGLIRDNSLRSAGKLPLFPKSDVSPLAHAAQVGVATGLRALGRFGFDVQAAAVPEFIARRNTERLRVVIKSVRPHGCVRLIRDAMPDSRVIVILRHPCGQVASLKQGAAAGRFVSASPIDLDLAEDCARRHGETRPFSCLSQVARYAWNWAAFTETLLGETEGHANLRIVRYVDLCGNPLAEARRLTSFADLPWHQQTERFISRSTRSKGNDRYYGVFRNSAECANRWRSVLSAAEQREIMTIAETTGYARFWPYEETGRLAMREPSQIGIPTALQSA